MAYPALFAAIGTTYGAGDGSTTFNLPNRYDKMPMGGGGVYTVGSTGGFISFTITAAHLPVNSPWTIHDPGHGHSISSGFITGTGGSGSNATAGSGAHADSIVATARASR